MIRYLLDTDVVSQSSKRKPNANAMNWLARADDAELAISVITMRERWEGAARAVSKGAPHAGDIVADVENLLVLYRYRILPIDDEVAKRWAALLVPDRSRPDDKAQVAVAAVHGLTLVSLNAKDMQGFGVPVLNPGRMSAKLYST